MASIHVEPVNDLINHEDTSECVCGPVIEPIVIGYDKVNLLVIHNSLDGRENNE